MKPLGKWLEQALRGPNSNQTKRFGDHSLPDRLSQPSFAVNAQKKVHPTAQQSPLLPLGTLHRPRVGGKSIVVLSDRAR